MRILSCGVLVCMVLFGTSGCDKDKKAQRQRQALEAKRAEVFGDVDKALTAWIDEMVRTLPTEVKKIPKVRSPLEKWRLDAFNFDWQRPVGAALAKAKGTAFEAEVQAIPDFFDAMEKFWKKQIDYKDYQTAYDKIKATSKDPLVLTIADFDQTFVHVVGFYNAQDLEGDDRAVAFFRFWQVAFRFPREYSESVSEYLARLCKAKLAEYCKTVPFESMHFAMEVPYLREVQRIVGEYLKAHPDCKLNPVFAPYLAEVEAILKSPKEYREDPVMPTTISRANWAGDLFMTVTPRGVDYEDRHYLDFSKGWSVPDKDWKKFEADVGKVQEDLEKERGPENMEILVAAMDKDAPMSVAAGLVSAVRTHAARYITFGGRRRADNLVRRTVVGRLQFREVPIVDRVKVEVTGGKPLTCRLLGQSSDAQDLPSRVGPVVLLGRDDVRLGKWESGKVTDVKSGDIPAALAHLASGTGLLLVQADVTVERFLSVLEPLFLKCKAPDCMDIADLSPVLEVQICTAK